jgi:hypothetical protein
MILRKLWSYGSRICYQCLYILPLMLWVRISIMVRCTTLCYEVCQWRETVWWFSSVPPVSSTNKSDRHDIAEILLKVALKHHQTNLWSMKMDNIKGYEGFCVLGFWIFEICLIQEIYCTMIKTFVFYFTTLGTYKIVEQKQLVHYILSQMI